MDELTEEVPDHASIDEGYSVGCKSAKGWLALASAAIAVAKAFTPPPQAATTSSHNKLPNTKQYANSWHFTWKVH